jgi:hypothetical protein
VTAIAIQRTHRPKPPSEGSHSEGAWAVWNASTSLAPKKPKVVKLSSGQVVNLISGRMHPTEPKRASIPRGDPKRGGFGFQGPKRGGFVFQVPKRGGFGFQGPGGRIRPEAGRPPGIDSLRLGSNHDPARL